MSTLVKAAFRSSLRNVAEFIAIVALIAFSLSLYITASVTYASTSNLFKNYLRESYGDVLVVGYIPKEMDNLASHLSWVKDYAGFAVVPGYGVTKSGKTYPLLLGYTDAAYRNNTLLGGFKAKPLKEGQALLLRQGSSFLHPGMHLTIYLAITVSGAPTPFNETIVGYAEGGLPLPAGPVVFLSPPDGRRLVNDFGGYTVYSFILKKELPENKVVPLVERIVKEVGGYIGFVYYTKKDLIYYPGQDVIAESSNALKYVSLVSWLVATVIIVIISIIYIEKNIKELGTLRVIGTTKGDLAKYLLVLWGLRIYLGLIAAIVVGYVVAIYAIHSVLSHPRLQPLLMFLHIVVPAKAVITLLGLSTATLILSVVISLAVLSRLRISEALTFYGLKLRIKEESSLPFSLMLAVSELRSVLWRSLATVLIVALTVSLLVLPFAIGDSLTSIHVAKGFDVKVTFLIIPRISPPLQTALSTLDFHKATSASLWLESLYGSVGMRSEIDVNGKIHNVYTYSCLMALKGSCWEAMPPLLKGHWPRGDHEIAISLLASKLFNLKVGDVITLYRHYRNKDFVDKVKVVGIYDETVYPPSIVIPRNLAPPINTLKVFVIRVTTQHPDALALDFQNTLISEGYAAVSMTWKAYAKELSNSLKFIATSVKNTIFNSFVVVALGSTAFALSDVSTRKKLLALFKAIGLTTKDYFVTTVTKWYVIAIVAIPLTTLMLISFADYGCYLLSKIYYIQQVKIPLWYLALIVIIPIAIGFVVAGYYRFAEYREELKTN
ncbi:hypothetical protein IPA_04050 [Ignicoccus pacificus DSM 13166]|uniref:ABC3 transporter permease C-terminal domain-containing protein n=1 Tax=Ignicoccus pacificus DSM 13166 TaxID=940294 RepID=A0A977KB34_9CREN|nr:hypothetical protein IPA_04050 [Ignicoccus pacificus DSM 13166]